jgi:hypothetical protein
MKMASTEVIKPDTISSVKVNCGCGFSYMSENPVSLLAAAIKHVRETSHTLDIVGRIKPAIARVKAYIPPFNNKFIRKDNEQIQS